LAIGLSLRNHSALWILSGFKWSVSGNTFLRPMPSLSRRRDQNSYFRRLPHWLYANPSSSSYTTPPLADRSSSLLEAFPKTHQGEFGDTPNSRDAGLYCQHPLAPLFSFFPVVSLTRLNPSIPDSFFLERALGFLIKKTAAAVPFFSRVSLFSDSTQGLPLSPSWISLRILPSQSLL